MTSSPHPGLLILIALQELSFSSMPEVYTLHYLQAVYRLQGQHPEGPQLNATGAAQARALAARLARGDPCAPDLATRTMRGDPSAPDLSTGGALGDLQAPDLGMRTARGDRGAPDLASGGAGPPITAIYSSDLQRALQTAEIAAESIGVPVTSDAVLRERHLGVLEVSPLGSESLRACVNLTPDSFRR